MTCTACGCPSGTHRHHNHGTYCGRPDGCNRYRPRRDRWWQIWRKP
jgi:hypothetical protein